MGTENKKDGNSLFLAISWFGTGIILGVILAGVIYQITM